MTIKIPNRVSPSILRNAKDEWYSINHARRILETIYGPESHYFSRVGSSLDLNNCIDMDWKGYRVAVRDNNSGLAYWNDIRIRAGTVNGEQRSEVDKLLTANPLPDIYVFTYTEPVTYKLVGWNLINVRSLVSILSDLSSKYTFMEASNRSIVDKTTPFRIYDLRKYPQIVAASSFRQLNCSSPLPSLQTL